MEVNIGQIIYPQNIKKYSGSIYGLRSKAKNGNNKIVSFCVKIKTANFLYRKNFSSRVEAESELIRQNHENKLDIKNVMIDTGDHYAMRISNGKEFLADKVSHSTPILVTCKKNNSLHFSGPVTCVFSPILLRIYSK